MRVCLTSVCFVLCVIVCEAQSYVPFPTNSATWFDFVHTGGNEQPPSSALNEHRIAGDTLINSTIYLKLYETTSGTLDYLGGLREDDDRNIWLLPAFSGFDAFDFQTFLISDPPEEVLLYSFNDLTIGEPVAVNSGNSNYVVINIDSIDVAGTYRNRYRLSCDHLIGSQDIWIEGIGSIHGLLSPLQYEFEWALALECFSQDSINWDNPFTSFQGCDIELAAGTPIRPTSTKIFPNPCSDHLSIQGFGPGQYMVQNFIGQALSKDQLVSNGEIPVSQLEPGAYLLTIESLDGWRRTTERFVVQR